MRCDDNSIRQSLDFSCSSHLCVSSQEKRSRKKEKKIHFRSRKLKRKKEKKKNENMPEEMKRKYSHSTVSMDFMDAICAPDAFTLNGWRWWNENRNLYSGSDFQSTNTTYFLRTIWTGKTIYIERWNVRSSVLRTTRITDFAIHSDGHTINSLPFGWPTDRWGTIYVSQMRSSSSYGIPLGLKMIIWCDLCLLCGGWQVD